MKRIYIIILVALLTSVTAVAKKQKQLVILHTNDTHSTILPVSAQLPDTMKAGRRSVRRSLTCCSSTVVTSHRARPTTRCSKATSRWN